MPERHPTPPITRLLISCPDQPGIVAATSGFLTEAGANIVRSDQHTTDPRGGTFYMRMEFDLALSPSERAELETRFARDVGEPRRMQWRMWDATVRKRVAILVSREDHCLLDLLWRRRRGELPIEVPLVVSNHETLREDVASFGLRYEHVPVERGRTVEAERRLLELVRESPVDLVVLARYMQILSGELLEALAAPVINIHHSFLPAFAGAQPYAQAKARGVKLIGATAHYVTEQLDDGPIIEQDTVRVSHREDVPALMRLGADIERTVLARAVRWHCEDRVLRHGETTVVF
ncbi:MAG TPA: formyltetrahydrofolate deformylase [Solirubrobacteraceae bacterium]|jgi:formyltetrahydrofolate deformylase|nr:formyltetrahydrofolate deformylase [Solirubrobacteraceae bacterium]